MWGKAFNHEAADTSRWLGSEAKSREPGARSQVGAANTTRRSWRAMQCFEGDGGDGWLNGKSTHMLVMDMG